MARQRGSGFVMITTVLLMGFFYYFWKFKYPDQNTVVATIDDKVITLSHLKKFAQNVYGHYDPERAEDVLDLMITQELLILHAERTNIVKDKLKPRFDKQMQYTKERLMLENFFEIDAEGKTSNTQDEIRAHYESQPLFVLQAINIPYSEQDALQKANKVSRDLNSIQDFNIVFSQLYPNRKWVKQGNVGIYNYNNMPPHFQEIAKELPRTGTATKPIENEYGYTIYYRDAKPSFNQARDFCNKEITARKLNDYILKRYETIIANNRHNLYNIDRIRTYNERIHRDTPTHRIGVCNLCRRTNDIFANEVLVNNSTTNDNLIYNELTQKLNDLYNIYCINTLKVYEKTEKDENGKDKTIIVDEFLDYVNLFIGQKVLLSLAKQHNYFEHPTFQKLWRQEVLSLMENQNQEIINYMMEEFNKEYIRDLPEEEIRNFYQRDLDLYRRSDFFKLQTIVTQNRNNAVRAYNEAVTTRDFDTAVLKYSNDPYKNITKGIGPYQNRDALEKSYDILIKHRKGDIVPPIEVDVGVWHTYKILGHIKGAVKPFEEVKTQVSTKLTFELMKDYLSYIIRTHKVNVETEKYKKNLNPTKKEKELHWLLQNPFTRDKNR